MAATSSPSRSIRRALLIHLLLLTAMQSGCSRPSAPAASSQPPAGPADSTQHDDEGAAPRPTAAAIVAGGPSAYRGRPVDETWLAEAMQRIDRIRAADFRIAVRDAAGQPIRDARLRVRMIRHGFLWGSALSDGIFLNQQPEAQADRQRYLDEFARLFNIATIEGRMRWRHWDLPGSRAQLREMMDWCRSQGIPLHGHTLVYPGWKHLPERAVSLRERPEELRRLIDQHILDQAGTLRGRVASWDVLNEPYSLRDLRRIVSLGDMARWFTLARQADPDARLLVNENNIVSSGVKIDGYLTVVRELLEAGAPIDAIGVQGHFRGSRFHPVHNPLPTPRDLWERLERVAALGRPIRVTEFDIFNDVPDHPLLLSEDDQARLTREFLITVFSHPSVEGVTLWGFWDGAHWMKNAPLYRRDWSLKPSGRVWMELVRGRWWTDVNGRTSPEGTYRGRGYLGEYEATAQVAGRILRGRFTLNSSGADLALTLD